MGRAGRIAAVVVVAIALVLVLAQLLLPGIAASTISSRLRRYGHVQSVSVSAWPALELLWEKADSVKVRARDLSVSTQRAAKLIWEGGGANSIDMSAQTVRVGTLRLSDVSVRKRGSRLSGHGLASAADVKAALPPGMSVSLLRSGGGSVEVRASGGLFGVSASLDAVAGPREGRLVAQPLGALLAGFQLTLFSDPHVYVQGVGASAVGAGGYATSYELQIDARLR